MFKSGELKALHLNRRALNEGLDLTQSAAFQAPTENSMEKHRGKNQKKKDHHEKDGHRKQQHRQSARKSSAQETLMAPCHSSAEDSPLDGSISHTTTANSDSPISIKHHKVSRAFFQSSSFLTMK